MSTPVGFMSANSCTPIILCVCGVKGQCREMMSLRRRSSSSESTRVCGIGGRPLGSSSVHRSGDDVGEYTRMGESNARCPDMSAHS
jgi:hypothetical protein